MFLCEEQQVRWQVIRGRPHLSCCLVKTQKLAGNIFGLAYDLIMIDYYWLLLIARTHYSNLMKWCCCSASSPLLMPNTTATSWNDVAVVRPRLCSCQTLLSLCLRVYNSIILLSSFDSVRVLNISFACSNYCFLSKVWYVLQYRSVNGFGSRLESTWNSLLKCVHASGEILEDKASDEVIGNWTVEETIEDGKTDGRNREVAVETVQGEMTMQLWMSWILDVCCLWYRHY